MLDWIDIKGALLVSVIANYWIGWKLMKLHEEVAKLRSENQHTQWLIRELRPAEDDGSYIPD